MLTVALMQTFVRVVILPVLNNIFLLKEKTGFNNPVFFALNLTKLNLMLLFFFTYQDSN